MIENLESQFGGRHLPPTIRASSRGVGLGASGRNLKAKHRLTDLPHDISFLHKFGIGYPDLKAAEARAKACGVPAMQALISAGVISEEDYFRCAASELGLEFAESVPGDAAIEHEVSDSLRLHKLTKLVPMKDGGLKFHIVPQMNERSALEATLANYPAIKSKLRVTTRTANFSVLEARSSAKLVQKSIARLWNNHPALSARKTTSLRQIAAIVMVIAALIGLMRLAGWDVAFTFHLSATLFFLSCVAVRLFGAISFPSFSKKQRDFNREMVSQPDKELPVYSVLVALYKEAGQVEPLVAALSAIDWPREKLEIKLVCEVDDLETTDAVRKCLRETYTPYINLVEVPNIAPRTKPKALNYALPLCRGRFVVIYDAEDRPDPLQFREAFAAFEQADESLVCVQAPLAIYNGSASWLSGMFAIEYSALFDGLLPALASKKLPFPLGGTSNHFRRSSLEKAGAWDPYNVTEDADLGTRFARYGLCLGTITRPTYEDAPTELSVWVKQRTRWFKGWLQTWFVHMRHPVRLSRDLGLAGTVAFHLMITGMILSALVHPFLIVFVSNALWRAWEFGPASAGNQSLFWLDLSALLLGYFSFGFLAWRTLPVRGLGHLRKLFWTIPVYWMLLSVAAWRAVWHLIRRPHEWEKTPHGSGSSVSQPPIRVPGNVSTVSSPVPDSLT
mgnify:CR=1 FL=1